MISRRTFLIGINSLVIAPQVFSATLGSSALAMTGSAASGLSSTLPSTSPLQFKVYGWNADHSHASDPGTSLIYLSSTWRSGWM